MLSSKSACITFFNPGVSQDKNSAMDPFPSVGKIPKCQALSWFQSYLFLMSPRFAYQREACGADWSSLWVGAGQSWRLTPPGQGAEKGWQGEQS